MCTLRHTTHLLDRAVPSDAFPTGPQTKSSVLSTKSDKHSSETKCLQHENVAKTTISSTAHVTWQGDVPTFLAPLHFASSINHDRCVCAVGLPETYVKDCFLVMLNRRMWEHNFCERPTLCVREGSCLEFPNSLILETVHLASVAVAAMSPMNFAGKLVTLSHIVLNDPNTRTQPIEMSQGGLKFISAPIDSLTVIRLNFKEHGDERAKFLFRAQEPAMKRSSLKVTYSPCEVLFTNLPDSFDKDHLFYAINKKLWDLGFLNYFEDAVISCSGADQNNCCIIEFQSDILASLAIKIHHFPYFGKILSAVHRFDQCSKLPLCVVVSDSYPANKSPESRQTSEFGVKYPSELIKVQPTAIIRRGRATKGLLEKENGPVHSKTAKKLLKRPRPLVERRVNALATSCSHRSAAYF